MLLDWLELVGGACLIYFGAEWLVGGASALALSLRVPKFFVGLTVVAYGTSLPEAWVSIEAARQDHPELALGNILGSNISNMGLVLGISALVRPLPVEQNLSRRELPVFLLSALALPFILLDELVSKTEAIILLLSAAAYTGFMLATLKRPTLNQAPKDVLAVEEIAEKAGAPAHSRLFVSLSFAFGGLVLVLMGGHFLVSGAVTIASRLGFSEQLIGLSIVALGTSLPELVTSVLASRKGFGEIAVGNVVGSNIFNILLCLGIAALSGQLVGAPRSFLWELAALVLMTALTVYFLRTERRVRRREGGILLLLYLIFYSVRFWTEM